MLDVGVYATIRDLERRNLLAVDVRMYQSTDQADKMSTAGGVLCVLEARNNVLVLVELALLDALVNAHNVLPHDPTSTNVEVPTPRDELVCDR